MLAGCAPIPKGQIAGGATDYNLAVEKAQNEMLLLNIIRASKRHPMYFTVLNDVKASMVYTVQAGMYVPLGKFGSNTAGSGLYTIAPGAAYTSNPLFDVALLNSKEFVRGMLEPVQPQTFDHFWQQGWSKEMLLYLFVHRMEVGGRMYSNNPFRGDFGDFEKEVRHIVDNECELTVSELPADVVGPEIKAEVAAADLQKLVELHKAGLMLAPATTTNGKVDTYQLKSIRQGEYAIECRARGSASPSERYVIVPDTQARPSTDRKEGNRILLRSPESILYYLGELVRVEKAADRKIAKPPILRGGRDGSCETRLFVARESRAGDEHPFAAVDYEGATYVIPRADYSRACPESSSTYVLSLVSLLTSKQTAADLPAPVGIVTAIGRTQ
jgi:hypothetical protein